MSKKAIRRENQLNLSQFKLVGRDCTLRSTDCAQCRQAPPGHYMEHFHMVSAKVAGKPFAKVNQCYLCHQTTSWNDIRGVGSYKHHQV